jgi:type II secretory pathway pseudopilin PulG
MKKTSGLTFFELLVAASIIFTLMGVFAVYSHTYIKVARETALRNELSSLRMSIEYYRIVNGRLPDMLADLVNEPLTKGKRSANIKDDKFLSNFRVSKDGFLLDPFMNKYSYDNKSGRVWSESEGHSNW